MLGMDSGAVSVQDTAVLSAQVGEGPSHRELQLNGTSGIEQYAA